MNISFLPRDVQRKIFKYICSGTACIILDAIKNDKFKLQYVRVYKFVCLNYRNIKIWDELKPSSTHFRCIFHTPPTEIPEAPPGIRGKSTTILWESNDVRNTNYFK